MPLHWEGLWRRAFASEEEARATEGFCERVVRAGRVTPAQVQECLRELAMLRGTGCPQRIEHLLLAKGYLHAHELAELLGDGAPTPAAPESPEAGTPLGKYLLRRPIGRGGMGVVYEADDPRLKRRVAVKVVREDQAGPEGVARLHREGAIMAQLRHPNIVAVYEVGVAQDASGQSLHYIAMEYVPGRTLAEAMADRAVKRSDKLRMLEEIARAVAYAHSMGVLHRDLKPGNVLVEFNGRVLLTDFGLARAANFSNRLTRSVDVLGTPLYMAPEQAMGKMREIDERTDVYALGVMLYEILVGRPPFEGKTPEKLYQQIVSSDPVTPGRLRNDVKRDLEVVCLKAMEKERRRRYRTALAFAEDLARFRRGEPIQARPASRAYRLHRWAARRRIPLVAAGAIVTVSLAALWIVGTIKSHADSNLYLENFKRGREAAVRAYTAEDWPRAEAAAADALAIRRDAELERIFQDSRGRRIREEARRRILETKIWPLSAMIQATRPLFYVKGEEIYKRLPEVERAVKELEQIVGEPEYRELAEVWVAIGMGFYFIGDGGRAEKALLKAEELGTQDRSAADTLGRISLERLAEIQMFFYGPSERLEERCRELCAQALKYFELVTSRGGEQDEMNPHIGEGYRLWAEGKYDAVDKLCREELQKHESSSLGKEEYWNLLAAVAREPNQAEECITKAIQEVRPHYPWGYYLRGMSRAARGEFDLALDDLSRAVALAPGFGEAYLGRGDAKRLKGDLKGALEDVDQAIAINPESARAHDARGMVMKAMGRTADALADFKRATELDPTLARYYCYRGGVLKEKTAFDGALRALNHAIELDPTLAEAYRSRAFLRRPWGELKEAIADLTKAFELDPTLPGLLHWLGVFHRDRGDFDDAITVFSKLIEQEPSLAQAYFERGFTKRMKGDLEGAKIDFSEALRRNPRLAESYRAQGIEKLKMNDPDGAIVDFTKAIELRPGYAKAHDNRGTAYGVKGDLPRAFDDFSEAIRIDPGEAAYWWNRARLRKHQGDRQGAAGDARQALKVAPPEWPERSDAERLLAEVQ